MNSRLNVTESTTTLTLSFTRNAIRQPMYTRGHHMHQNKTSKQPQMVSWLTRSVIYQQTLRAYSIIESRFRFTVKPILDSADKLSNLLISKQFTSQVKMDSSRFNLIWIRFRIINRMDSFSECETSFIMNLKVDSVNRIPARFNNNLPASLQLQLVLILNGISYTSFPENSFSGDYTLWWKLQHPVTNRWWG